MSHLSGNIDIINTSLTPIFTNAAHSDFAIYTETSNQSIHVGAKRGTDSMLKVTASNAEVAGGLLVTGAIDFKGALTQNGTPFQSGTPGLSNNGSNVFVLPGSNLGIGTSDPQARLHVAGTARIDGDIALTNQLNLSGVKISKRTSVAQPQNVTVANLNLVSNASDVSLNLQSGQTQFKFLDSNDATVATVTETGDIDFKGALTQNGVPFQSGTPGLSNSSSNIFVIQGSNLGVGTSAPSNLLHVAGDARIDGDIVLSSNVKLNGLRLARRAIPNQPVNITSQVVDIPALVSNASDVSLVLSAPGQSQFKFVNSNDSDVATLTETGTLTAPVINATTTLQQAGVAVATTGHVHDASAITTGVLPVAYGGTGVTSATGTGSVVLSAGPTFTGVVTAASINTTNLTVSTMPTWTSLTLQNSWINYGGEFGTAQYTKDSLGKVHLKGVIRSGTVGAAFTIFNLPVGYRPSTTRMFNCLTNLGVPGDLRIVSSGDASLHTGNNGFLSFDSISFWP